MKSLTIAFFLAASIHGNEIKDDVSMFESLVSREILSATCLVRCRDLQGDQRDICTRVCSLDNKSVCDHKMCGVGCKTGCSPPVHSTAPVQMVQKMCDVTLYTKSVHNTVFIVGGKDHSGMWRLLKELSSEKVYLSAPETTLYSELAVLAVSGAGVSGRSTLNLQPVQQCGSNPASVRLEDADDKPADFNLFIVGAGLVLVAAAAAVIVLSVLLCRRQTKSAEKVERIERLEREGVQLENVFVDLCQNDYQEINDNLNIHFSEVDIKPEL